VQSEFTLEAATQMASVQVLKGKASQVPVDRRRGTSYHFWWSRFLLQI